MDEASSCRAVSAPAVLRTLPSQATSLFSGIQACSAVSKLVQRYRCNVSSPLLAVFQTQNGRAARKSARSTCQNDTPAVLIVKFCGNCNGSPL